MDMDILRKIIKSNLISYGLQPDQIDAITEQLLADIIDLINPKGEKSDRD